MCYLFASTFPQEYMSRLFSKAPNRVGNLAPLPEVFPDRMAPIPPVGADESELVMAQQGLSNS